MLSLDKLNYDSINDFFMLPPLQFYDLILKYFTDPSQKIVFARNE